MKCLFLSKNKRQQSVFLLTTSISENRFGFIDTLFFGVLNLTTEKIERYHSCKGLRSKFKSVPYIHFSFGNFILVYCSVLTSTYKIITFVS